MGESSESKRQRQRLEEADRRAQQQQTEALAQQKEFFARAAEKSPLEQRREASLLEDIDYFSKAQPDYSTAPKGMIDDTAFTRAAMNRLRERTSGQGVGGMYGANPTLLALNKDAQDRRIAEEGAGAYAGRL